MHKNKKIIFLYVFVIGGIIVVGWLVFSVLLKGFSNNNWGNHFRLSDKSSSEISTPSLMVPEKKSINPDFTGIEMESNEVGEAIFDKKIIKNGNLNLRVERVDNAVSNINQIAINNSGEVFSSNFHETPQGQKSGTMTVRVPVDKFEKTMKEIKEVAQVVSIESTTSQDVTEQYADLELRLKSKEAELEAFLTFLDRAEKMEDILKITKEVSQTRAEIETLKGKIRFLESQTAMSTINVNLFEDIQVQVSEDWRPLEVFKKSLNALLTDFQNLVNRLIIFFFRVLPAMIVYIIVFIILLKLAKYIYGKFLAPKKKKIKKEGKQEVNKTSDNDSQSNNNN